MFYISEATVSKGIVLSACTEKYSLMNFYLVKLGAAYDKHLMLLQLLLPKKKTKIWGGGE